MADIAGRPFLEYVLDVLARRGFERVVLAVGYMGHCIQEHFGERYSGISLQYAVEQEPLGTGGALMFAASYAKSENVFVMNGDTLVAVDFESMEQLHNRVNSNWTIVLREVPDTGRFGAVRVVDGVVTSFAEKGVRGKGLINAGVYLVRIPFIRRFQLGRVFSLEHDLLTRHLGTIHPVAFRTSGYFIDIGVPDQLERARVELPAVSIGARE
jgi:D-glycero-alpha-D-manno-heptose 1-phosphate guanylyltransferase